MRDGREDAGSWNWTVPIVPQVASALVLGLITTQLMSPGVWQTAATAFIVAFAAAALVLGLLRVTPNRTASTLSEPPDRADPE